MRFFPRTTVRLKRLLGLSPYKVVKDWPAGYTNDTPCILIGGSQRSGTTMLITVLDSHPQIYSAPIETDLFDTALTCNLKSLAKGLERPVDELTSLYQDAANYPDFAMRCLSAEAECRQRSIWAEKTPENVMSIERSLATYTAARFVHIIRDGRDVVCSLRKLRKFKVVDGQRVELESEQHSVGEFARHWVEYVRTGLASHEHERYHELKYEDLVLDFEAQARAVIEFLQLPWHDGTLEYWKATDRDENAPGVRYSPKALKPPSPTSIGRWRDEFTERDKDEFRAFAGDLLIELGYETTDQW